MFFWLSQHLIAFEGAFRIFQYLSFRSIMSSLTALVMVLWASPRMIRALRELQIGQAIRELGPQSHMGKKGTPTMGGVLMLIALTVSLLLWGDLSNRLLWVALLVTLAIGVVGGVDDYRKVVKKNSDGLSARWKFFWQSVIALSAGAFLFATAGKPIDTQLVIPFFKNVMPNLGLLYIVLTYFVIVGSSNAVNLTDGLDGLALMPTVLVALALGVFAYISGNAVMSKYLLMPFIPGAGEIAIFCSTLAGAGLGFLWYNTYPAQVFMGDVGSLSLGAALGIVAVCIRQELLLLWMGGIFVAETLSVILQVGYFKFSGGKRIFRMAPLHHHFELKGWPEPKVIVRFWIITVILVLLALSTLKLR